MVALFLAEGFEEIEAVAPVDILKRAGIDVKIVSITKNKQVCGAHGIIVTADTIIDEILNCEFEMLILPGGMPGTVNLIECNELLDLIKKEYVKGTYIAAICAAPRVLDTAGVLDGKNITCYPSVSSQIKHGIWADKIVCQDGNIITSKGAGTAIDFGLYLVEVLLSKLNSNEISRGICYDR